MRNYIVTDEDIVKYYTRATQLAQGNAKMLRLITKRKKGFSEQVVRGILEWRHKLLLAKTSGIIKCNQEIGLNQDGIEGRYLYDPLCPHNVVDEENGYYAMDDPKTEYYPEYIHITAYKIDSELIGGYDGQEVIGTVLVEFDDDRFTDDSGAIEDVSAICGFVVEISLEDSVRKYGRVWNSVYDIVMPVELEQ